MKKSTADIYEILHQIGRGSYASVHKAINKKTGELCAIKKIPVEQSGFTNLKNEIGILSDCECKNIVRFLDSAFSGDEVSISMEYCCGGSVKDVMRALGITMSENQIIVIVRDVLKGLDYLHSKNKTHRDVKAANILLDGEGVAKLADFGVSEQSDTPSQKQSLIGTLLWLPPEVINKNCNYKPVIDIWSLGITMIEMGEGDPPYYDIDQKAALVEIANLDKLPPTFREPTKWSVSMREFLGLCLNKDAFRRKTARELLSCDIIKNSPSNEIIKSLVEEVCSFRLSREKNLRKKSRYLRKEFQILDNIYDERKKKVLRVDPLTSMVQELKQGFFDLCEQTKIRDLKVKEMDAQLKTLVEQSRKLEKDRNELEGNLNNSRKRNEYLMEQLNVIQTKLKTLEVEELFRRKKLSTLES